ncbi:MULTISPECIES: hypothetical protein [Aquimarina]|uniref:Uncharacterized protein n=1 Tax=Aquimarina algiphila TaxID=2047982 RepID=A0A554VET0_9FLAO|nr:MULTISPECIES: hypothetical protein [Aquimarina]TSE05603.1 hypothetical protein FOF46_22415 [Aquimarina algiphila]
MDLNELNLKLKNDGLTRTEFFSELTSKLKEKDIIKDSTDVVIKSDDNGNLSNFVIKPGTSDAITQLDGINTTIELLKKYGVNDLESIHPFNSDIDPYSWNIVYKDGGWVVNS